MLKNKKVLLFIIPIIVLVIIGILFIHNKVKVKVAEANLNAEFFIKTIPFKYNYDEQVDAYSKKTTKIEDISDDVLSYTIFNLSDKVVLTEEDQRRICNNKLCNGISYLNETELNNRLKNYYNKDKVEDNSTKTESILYKRDSMYFIKDNKYNTVEKHSKLKKQQYENDDYVIYEYAFFIVKDKNVGILYSKDTNKDNFKLMFNANEIDAVNIEDYFEKDKNYQLYKHVFKKDKNDNYYWYSTSIEKDV